MNSMTFTTTEIREILRRRQHPWQDRLYRFDVRLTYSLARHSLTLLRLTAALVFLWVGAPMLFPGVSPTEPMIAAILPGFPIILLGVLEIAIALSFALPLFNRALVPLLFMHLLGTLLVMALRATQVFQVFPYVLTFEGQYLATSLIVLSAGLVVAATARGGGLTSEPDALEKARRVERKAE